MNGLRLEGRLGVETVNALRGCCAESILGWRPQTIGEKHKCLYCDNPMKTIRAGEHAGPEWVGMLNETHIERAAPEVAVSSIWFSSKRFDALKAERWCEERGLVGKTPEQVDGSAYRVVLGKTAEDTERAVWAAPGVLAIIGIAKMDTGSLATGGSLNPLQQGAAAEEEETTPAPKEEPEAPEEKSLTGLEKAMKQFSEELQKAIS